MTRRMIVCMSVAVCGLFLHGCRGGGEGGGGGDNGLSRDDAYRADERLRGDSEGLVRPRPDRPDRRDEIGQWPR